MGRLVGGKKKDQKAKQTTAFKGLNLAELKDYQKTNVRQHVQAVAEQVATAASNFVPATSEDAKLTSDDVTPTLRQAAFGDKAATEGGVTIQQAFRSTMNNQARENNCTTTSGGDGGKISIGNGNLPAPGTTGGT
ncbi:uncharacterized protein TEOVI_000563100 [Trypanosoma equiperdum]|uniref:Trypanosome variant surface glycoprotein B-type N-terminal domain-containing protein n=1 Tax=Trypanosoma equiperdum TaxID=5694 RepID=A0A1G4I272_TRYEQ|nr:hypothetical protein TEOVI_000563100 [Trypanosoma equiperdum]